MAKINKRTGQIYKDDKLAEEAERQGKKLEDYNPKPQSYAVSTAEGGKEVSREEYKQEVDKRKFLAEGGREVVPNVETTPQELPGARDIPVTNLNLSETQKGPGVEPPLNLLEKSSLAQAMATQQLLQGEDINKIVELTNKSRQLGLTPEQASADPIVQGLLNLQLSELDAKVLSDGQAKVTTFQQSVESIPVVGSLASKYIRGLQTPSGRVDTVIKEIEVIDQSISEWASAASSNPSRAGDYLKLIQDTEQEFLYMESKIKLLTIQSPELQSDPEEISRIKRKIERTKLKIVDSTNKIQLTGGLPQ